MVARTAALGLVISESQAEQLLNPKAATRWRKTSGASKVPRVLALLRQRGPGGVLGGVLIRSRPPAETWRDYGSLFREYSTAVISPELLAALAQVEGAGNPVATTYWRWQRCWPSKAMRLGGGYQNAHRG